eukprot:CAMPEP_0194530152 /NCGR_PEP_ID=MMETSP0253-20130528/67008_1 /TAXON_ID=2966 /ORGANISM="Noctiluca scintillans" /LENGTH=139 /DNA_ID=CAMNT_0039375343 /DNA_START=21 /DNA_END=440 /DNA_ORIENTATION=+
MRFFIGLALKSNTNFSALAAPESIRVESDHKLGVLEPSLRNCGFEVLEVRRVTQKLQIHLGSAKVVVRNSPVGQLAWQSEEGILVPHVELQGVRRWSLQALERELLIPDGIRASVVDDSGPLSDANDVTSTINDPNDHI